MSEVSFEEFGNLDIKSTKTIINKLKNNGVNVIKESILKSYEGIEYFGKGVGIKNGEKIDDKLDMIVNRILKAIKSGGYKSVCIMGLRYEIDKENSDIKKYRLVGIGIPKELDQGKKILQN
jgi:hypothetical protein